MFCCLLIIYSSCNRPNQMQLVFEVIAPKKNLSTFRPPIFFFLFFLEPLAKTVTLFWVQLAQRCLMQWKASLAGIFSCQLVSSIQQWAEGDSALSGKKCFWSSGLGIVDGDQSAYNTGQNAVLLVTYSVQQNWCFVK